MDSSTSSSSHLPRQRGGSLPGRVLSWGAAFLCSIAMWEVVIRLFIEAPIPYHHVDGLGWMPVPHSRGLYTEEGMSVTEYNELGFRDRPVTSRRGAELRVLCLGDSFTEGRQVALEETYPDRLERSLAAHGAHARVFNGGRAHSSPVAAALLSDSYARLFDPDWVVVLFRSGGLQESLRTNKEVYLKDVDGRFDPVVAWQGDRVSWLKSQLLAVGARNSAALHWGWVRAAQILSAPDRPGHEGRAEPALAQDTLDRVARYLVAELSRRYRKVVIVHVPEQPMLGDPAGAMSSQEEAALRKAVAELGVSGLFLRDEMAADFRRSEEPMFGFANTVPGTGHPNSRAHALIADALAAFFSSSLVARPE